MKQTFILLLCLLLSIFLCGCQEAPKVTESQKVTINFANDDTVNGYRTEQNNSTIISGNDVTAKSETETSEDKSTVTYCANKNSKVFHKSSCGSVKTMKEENKYISSNRNTLINEGYTPCKRCNP